MKKVSLLLLFALAFIPLSFACINMYYSIDKQGHFHVADDIERGFNRNFNIELIAHKLPPLEEELRATQSYKKLSDYAVLLLKIGRKETALSLFIELNEHYPDEYEIAANLGTAYEINGEVDSALFFIKRAMELNPDSHQASEWVHIRVLETKKELAADSTYLKNNTVLKLNQTEKKDSAVRNQILVQVRERFPFTPGPDPIMASLLFDLAECYSNTSSIEYAKALYNISAEYYGNNDPVIPERINEMIALREAYKDKQPEDDYDEGMVIKISGIPYRTIIDDNNSPPYEPDWTTLNTDADELLKMVNWKLTEAEIEELESYELPELVQPIKKEKPRRRKRETIIYGLFGVSSIIVWILYFRKRS